MFNYIEDIIKVLAVILCIIGICLALFSAFSTCRDWNKAHREFMDNLYELDRDLYNSLLKERRTVYTQTIFLAIGKVFISVIVSVLMYGFGVLIEAVHINNSKLDRLIELNKK